MISLILSPPTKKCSTVRVSTNKNNNSKKDWDFTRSEHWNIVLNPTFSSWTDEKKRIVGSEIYNLLKNEITNLSFELGQDAYSIVEGMLLSSYSFDRFLSQKNPPKLMALYLGNDIRKESLQQLNAMIDAVTWTRDMVNLPVSHLNAIEFADAMKALCESKECKVDILTHAKIKAMKMGGILAVNKGSRTPPTFTIINYQPKKALNKNPIVLVGKGVVYDTGGLSLKQIGRAHV